VKTSLTGPGRALRAARTWPAGGSRSAAWR